MAASHPTLVRNDKPVHNLPPQPPVGRKWYIDEIVVAAFAFLGFGGAVFLPLRYNLPPIVVSFLLATGLAALTYRYLGGIEGTSFAIGALKLTGTLAALVGIAMLINSQLVSQTTVQVWYLSGRVVNEKKNTVDKLEDADFTVFPANAHAEQLGDFHVEFIRHTTELADNRSYLSVKHPGFGEVTIPLELERLKKLYPDATIHGKYISIEHIVLPESTDSGLVKGAPATLLTRQQLNDYNTASQSAKPANPNVGGVLQ
jgi:hypothetical protein